MNSEGVRFSTFSWGYLVTSLRPPQLLKSTLPSSFLDIETPLNKISSKRLSTPLGLNQYAPSSNAATLAKASLPELNKPTVGWVLPLSESWVSESSMVITPRSVISSEGAREIEPKSFFFSFALTSNSIILCSKPGFEIVME